MRSLSLNVLAAAVVAFALASTAATAAPVHGVDEQTVAIARMRAHGASYYDVLYQAERCEKAVARNAPSWKPYCDQFKLVVSAQRSQALQINDWCIAELKGQLVAATYTPLDDEVRANCAAVNGLDGTDKLQAVTRVMGGAAER